MKRALSSSSNSENATKRSKHQVNFMEKPPEQKAEESPLVAAKSTTTAAATSSASSTGNKTLSPRSSKRKFRALAHSQAGIKKYEKQILVLSEPASGIVSTTLAELVKELEITHNTSSSSSTNPTSSSSSISSAAPLSQAPLRGIHSTSSISSARSRARAAATSAASASSSSDDVDKQIQQKIREIKPIQQKIQQIQGYMAQRSEVLKGLEQAIKTERGTTQPGQVNPMNRTAKAVVTSAKVVKQKQLARCHFAQSNVPKLKTPKLKTSTVQPREALTEEDLRKMWKQKLENQLSIQESLISSKMAASLPDKGEKIKATIAKIKAALQLPPTSFTTIARESERERERER
eukprot:CAMPEP_0175152582 /NCGR_PEP_ID=MMETSP0087-20121206/19199_1 /TAXON_ID=136419 /ORGANISM="Unknown Unknown, Strain D1" /LENGTH=348 /DNA_ID=CAMNT_0016439041 /DNA_START=11 /DNA_END=1055 /DNA_ORIENTATION=+